MTSPRSPVNGQPLRDSKIDWAAIKDYIASIERATLADFGGDVEIYHRFVIAKCGCIRVLARLPKRRRGAHSDGVRSRRQQARQRRSESRIDNW